MRANLLWPLAWPRMAVRHFIFLWAGEQKQLLAGCSSVKMPPRSVELSFGQKSGTLPSSWRFPPICHEMITLLLATRNRHKTEEILAILGEQFRYLTLNDFPSAPAVIEDSRTFAGNATK